MHSTLNVRVAGMVERHGMAGTESWRTQQVRGGACVLSLAFPVKSVFFLAFLRFFSVFPFVALAEDGCRWGCRGAWDEGIEPQSKIKENKNIATIEMVMANIVMQIENYFK